MAATIEPSTNIPPTDDNDTDHDQMEKTIEPSTHYNASACDLKAVEPSVSVLSSVSDAISSNYSPSPEVQVSSDYTSSYLDSQFSSDSLSYSSDNESYTTSYSHFSEEQLNKVTKVNPVKVNKQKTFLILTAITFFIAVVIHLTIMIVFWEISKSRAVVTELDLLPFNLASFLTAIQNLTDSGIKRNMTRELSNLLSAEVGTIELDFLELKNSTAAKLAGIINGTDNRFENISNSFTQITSTFESIDKENIGSISSEEVFNILLTDGYSFTSCANIFKHSSSAQSGYYNLRVPNGSIINIYCARSCGDNIGMWTQVADVDITNLDEECPEGLSINLTFNRLCSSRRYYRASCTSTKFSVYGIKYSKVCGRIQAFQIGSPDAFGNSNPEIYTGRESVNSSIENNYVDGVSLTHGTSPRKHIWTFAAASDQEYQYPCCKCPCININFSRESFPAIPPFVGEDYFCGTGNTGAYIYNYFLNPLWDGENCGPWNKCCSLNNPPWFNRQLPQSTNDDIEMRVCRDEIAINEDIGIQMVELFVR